MCDAFLHVENASLHVVSLCGIGLDIGSALLLQLVAECGQILCLLYPAGRQFACLFGAEILQGVVGGEVINNQLKILLHLFAFRFSIFGTGYALLGALHLLIVFPGVLDGYQLCPAAQVFGVSVEDVTPLQRRHAKAVNFGIVYGQSKYGLAKNLNISNTEAQEFIDKYFEHYPGVKKYMEDKKEFANINGYVETIFGRKRYLAAELLSPNFQIREFAQRAAINQPLQGTAADLIKMAMIEVDKQLEAQGLKAKMIMQVHDELVFELPKEELETLKLLVLKAMELNQPLRVPLEVDINCGTSWKEG